MRNRKKEIPKGNGKDQDSWDPNDPGSCGPGGSQAYLGADFRG